LDEEKLKTFDDVGATTTSECLRCWARHLCGGGVSAVHQALGGDHRHPYAAWCEAQRAWLSAAIAAFNTLSSAGVNFSRMQQQLEPQQRPSLFALARAAFRLHLGVRPVEEADAAWLQQWENWNDAAYFTATETGLLLATRYDREMDAVHPRGVDRELVLVRRDGSPLGLLRLRPEHVPGTVRAWVYFRDAADYASDAARRSLQTIMQEAAQQQSVRMILTPAGPREDNLAALLRSLGFAEIGREREALYLQGHYDDTRMFALSLPIL
ncbi:MAG: GNAT family N-acetyltransferase, partial [Candidatus Hydrogenedentes bacterium]|nr:GNAT family N-acetyltransferase [Candidatus Hydrogenedentota bacterium]